MKISKTKSCDYWQYLKAQLEADIDNIILWEEAYDLFLERINTRYLDYTKIIENQGENAGEGFAIMTIYCSLIEFLETTYQGLNYKNKKNADLNKYEYRFGKSKDIFVSFLTNRKPFLLTENMATEFYGNVRCGLLHEAQTTGKWKIRVDKGVLITKLGDEYILDRFVFKKKMKQYLNLYKNNLLETKELKEAFIRKFDGICEN